MLTDSPTSQLAHLVNQRSEQRFSGSVAIFTYRTFPLDVRPPSGGSSVRDLRCGLCGVHLRLRVFSIPGTRTLRRRRLVLCVTGLLLAAILGIDCGP